MAIDPEAIERFLLYDPPRLPGFKGADPEWLRQSIYDSTGRAYAPKSQPRPPQLEGIAAALYLRRAMLFYDMRMGKALRSDCPVATPEGWRPISALRIGDFVMAPSGKPVKVLGVFPQGRRPMFRVTFTDGADTICDEEHLWAVNSALRRARKAEWQVKTLRQIREAGDLRDKNSGGWRHYIPTVSPVQYPERALPLEPYLLGVILGDGALTGTNLSITTDVAIIDNIALPGDVRLRSVPHASAGVATAYFIGSAGKNAVRDALCNIGLKGKASSDKFIPAAYLTASIDQRLALLAGLLDTDGWAQASGGSVTLCYGSTSDRLAEGVQELVRSLGGTCRIKLSFPSFTHKSEKRAGQPFYEMVIRLPSALGCPFRLPRKAAVWKPLTKFQPVRAIRSIREVPAAEAVCIKVDSADGLFVIRDYVVTHNTKMALDWAAHLRAAGIWQGKGLVIAHAPVALDVWEGEFAKHSDLGARAIRSGPKAADRFVDALVDDRVDLLVLAWPTLQSIFGTKRPNRKGVMKLYADDAALAEAAEFFSLAIIDEIHMCADYTSLRFDIGHQLVAKAHYRLGLTGTPIGRNPFAIWTQACLIDEGETLGRSYHFFEAAFGKKSRIHGMRPRGKDREGNWIYPMEYKFNKDLQPRLQAKLDSLSLSYKRSEIAEETIYAGTVELSMTAEQDKAYTAIIEEVIAMRDDEEERIKNAFIRMRQVASGFLPFIDDEGEERTIIFPNNAKIAWLEEFCREMDATIQFVIFYTFILSGNQIAALLDKLKIPYGRLDGQTRGGPQAVKDFQAGKKRILIANSVAGSMALDLPMADYLCFYESPTSPTIRAQCEARPMGRGAKPLVIDDLICSAVDRKVLGFVKEGKDALHGLIYERHLLYQGLHARR